MSHKDSDTWLLLGAAAVGLYYYLQSQGVITAPAAATPLSIYPEYAYTAQTSMAASPNQQAPAAVIIPSPLYSAVQAQEQAAILTQCVGSNVCSVLTADTQLGL